MGLIKDKIEISNRLEKEDIQNIENIIVKIHKRIDEYKKEKIQLLSDQISIVCDKILNQSYSLPITCSNGRNLEISLIGIPTLNLSDIVNNTLFINFKGITIKYKCEPFHICLDTILYDLNLRINSKSLTYNTVQIDENTTKFIIVST